MSTVFVRTPRYKNFAESFFNGPNFQGTYAARGSARTRESSPSRATQAQGRRPSVGPAALPSFGRCALFFYCRPQPESQQSLSRSPHPFPLLPIPSLCFPSIPSQTNPPFIPLLGVPSYNFLFDSTVPSDYFLFDGTVQSDNFSFDGTVPSDNFLFDGTVK